MVNIWTQWANFTKFMKMFLYKSYNTLRKELWNPLLLQSHMTFVYNVDQFVRPILHYKSWVTFRWGMGSGYNITC